MDFPGDGSVAVPAEHHRCLLGCRKSRSSSKAGELPERWDAVWATPALPSEEWEDLSRAALSVEVTTGNPCSAKSL